MPLLNFQKAFARAVELRLKRQTIRALRRDGRDPKPGQILYLYSGLRTKRTHKLGEERCTAARRIRIEEWHEIGTGRARLRVWLRPDSVRSEPTDEDELGPGDIEALARADGFRESTDLLAFFKAAHGLPFRGVLIQW